MRPRGPIRTHDEWSLTIPVCLVFQQHHRFQPLQDLSRTRMQLCLHGLGTPVLMCVVTYQDSEPKDWCNDALNSNHRRLKVSRILSNVFRDALVDGFEPAGSHATISINRYTAIMHESP